MKHQFAKTIYKWLTLMDISVDRGYLEYRLYSHPDFPSAFAITSLLTELGIENAAVRIDINELMSITDPFLAVIDDSDYILIDDVKQLDNRCKNFINRWTGVVILIEKPLSVIQLPELKQFTRDKSNLSLKRRLLFFLLSVLTIAALFRTTVYHEVVLFLFSIIGFVISAGIVLHELGIENMVFANLCRADSKKDCEALSHSKAATIFWGIKLSDVALSFFSGCIMLFLLQAFGPMNQRELTAPILAWIILSSFPFVVFSIYYQSRIIRKWCNSCLMIDACLLCMQFIELNYGEFKIHPSYSTASVFLSFMLPCAVWIFIRQLLDSIKTLTATQHNLLRVVRSAEVFDSYLKKQKFIDTSVLPMDFQVGNAHAPLQLVIVSAPYCRPCAEAHHTVIQLLNKHKGKIGITIRFIIHPDNPEDISTPVLEHMLCYASSITGFFANSSRIEKMIQDWYQIRNLEKFKILYPVTEETDVWSHLKKQAEWVKYARIEHTPSIFINGYQLQSPYTLHDLMEFASDLSNLFSEEERVILNEFETI